MEALITTAELIQGGLLKDPEKVVTPFVRISSETEDCTDYIQILKSMKQTLSLFQLTQQLLAKYWK